MLTFFNKYRKRIAVSAVLMIIAVAFALLGLWLGHTKQAKQTVAWQIRYETEHAAKQLISKHNTEYVEAAAHTLTKDQFKDMFAESFALFANNLNLKDINHYTEIKTTTEHNIRTTLRDSITRDTMHVKSFSYNDINLIFRGYTTSDSIVASYKHYLQLKIASGKKSRDGLWNKITLQPLKRKRIVQAVASDTNTVITNIQSTEIK